MWHIFRKWAFSTCCGSFLWRQICWNASIVRASGFISFFEHGGILSRGAPCLQGRRPSPQAPEATSSLRRLPRLSSHLRIGLQVPHGFCAPCRSFVARASCVLFHEPGRPQFCTRLMPARALLLFSPGACLKWPQHPTVQIDQGGMLRKLLLESQATKISGHRQVPKWHMAQHHPLPQANCARALPSVQPRGCHAQLPKH